MDKEEIRKKCYIGLSEDINGNFYPIYDFDKIWEMTKQIRDEDLARFLKRSAELLSEKYKVYDNACRKFCELTCPHLYDSYVCGSCIKKKEFEDKILDV